MLQALPARRPPAPAAHRIGPPAMPRSRLLLVLAMALVAALVVALTRPAPDRSAERRRLADAAGAVVLSVEASRVVLYDRQDRPVRLDSYRGRLVFVNFWATWCGPCKVEMPSLIALYEALAPADIAFVSIAEDDTAPPLEGWLRANPLPFDLFRDRPPRVEEPFEVTSYPTSFLIDRDGRALYRFQGARDWTTPEVRALLAYEGAGPRP